MLMRGLQQPELFLCRNERRPQMVFLFGDLIHQATSFLIMEEVQQDGILDIVHQWANG